MSIKRLPPQVPSNQVNERKDRAIVASALGVDPRLLKHYLDWEAQLRKGKKEFEVRWRADFKETASIKDFYLLRTLGTGSFGRVLLVKHKDRADKLFAVKMMDKKHIVKTKQVDHSHSEIRIMDAMHLTFLVHMEYYFKDNCYLFLVMPFVNGGEMFTHLRRLGKFEEPLAKFYAAQVILAFEYMHFIGMIYRDLKPENILIDGDGYLKITDFGFCKRIDDQRTWTLCGTPEYLAPEIIMNQGYNRSVDWWAFGILIYEMAAGYPPFYAKDPMKLYDKIVIGKYNFPPHFSRPLQHLLSNIIVVDRTKRFGLLRNGSKDMKGHDWFKSVDWDAVLVRKLKPSYKPKVTSAEDTTNFDAFEEEPYRVNSVEEYPNEFAVIKVRTT